MGFLREALLRVAERLSPQGLALDPAWEVVPLPIPPGTKRPYIDRICGTPGDVWVLGTVSSPVGELRFACRDQGSGYELVPDMPRGIGVDVWPIGRTDAWFAGYSGAIAHHDGTRWTRHVFAGFYYDFRDIVARHASDVWLAAGERIVHFDGKEFRVDQPPVLLGASAKAMWGTDTELLIPIYAGGVSSVARLGPDGTWSREPLGPGGAMWIHGSAANDVWVIGFRDDGWHFDGATWTRHTTGPGRFYAVHAAAPDRAYAVGDGGALARWDGTRWTTRSITSDRLVSIYEPRDGRLLAGGSQLYRQREPVR